MAFPRLPMSESEKARILKPGLISQAMLLRYNICYLTEWKYGQLDGWMDGWTDKWTALIQEQEKR